MAAIAAKARHMPASAVAWRASRDVETFNRATPRHYGIRQDMKRPRAPGQIEQVRLQYGALPFRRVEGIEIMLITSRETRRWIIPKGWPMKGRRPRGTAAGEAMEEAGISGNVAKAPIGSYSYIKRGLGGQSWPCRVDVFPLEVRVERATWRERKQRTRQWFSYIEAAEVVAELELRALILGFGVAFDRVTR